MGNSKRSSRKSFDPERDMNVTAEYLDDRPDSGCHLHTHGLPKQGKFDLMLRDVPLMYVAAGACLLNDVAQWLVSRDIKLRSGTRLELHEHLRVRFKSAIGCNGTKVYEVVDAHPLLDSVHKSPSNLT